MQTILGLIRSFREKNQTTLYYVVPIAVIILFSFTTGFFHINKKVINQNVLWDMAGRPYKTFLYELNLPHTVGAILVGGTPNNVQKIDETYHKVDTGDIFTSQLRSFLFGTKITEYSIASYINLIFGISAILFSLLTGYLVLKNGYASIAIFTAIIVFRNLCPGLIYGLPLKHTYAVFNPLLAFCIMIFIIIAIKNNNKKYWVLFVVSGFTMAYISHLRNSEGLIVIFSLILFTASIFVEHFQGRKENIIKLLTNILIIFVAIYAGYFGYQKMVAAFEHQRDVKFNLPVSEKILISGHPIFLSLYESLFRYDVPNKYGDKIGYDAFYERYPEQKKKHLDDVNYVKLSMSDEFTKAIKVLYFEYIINNPYRVLVYIGKSTYDYFLFLPYYSWTGNSSAHAYLPKINNNVIIERNDLAPDFKDTPFNWILNLKLKYLPESPLFWIYFISAYALLLNAVYAAITFTKKKYATVSADEVMESNLPIDLLRGMLIYFFFASVVRVLIPVHGQGAVVAFNVIIIYNMVRLAVTMRCSAAKTNIIQVGLLLLCILLLFSAMEQAGFNLGGRIVSLSGGIDNSISPNLVLNGGFRKGTNGWIAYKSSLSVAPEGQSGNCLHIATAENATGYVYIALPTKVGKTYKFEGYFKKGSASNGQIKVGPTVDDTSLYYSGVLSDIKWRKLKGVFKAASQTTYITLVDLTSLKGRTSFFDDISLTEIEY